MYVSLFGNIGFIVCIAVTKIDIAIIISTGFVLGFNKPKEPIIKVIE